MFCGYRPFGNPFGCTPQTPVSAEYIDELEKIMEKREGAAALAHAVSSILGPGASRRESSTLHTNSPPKSPLSIEDDEAENSAIFEASPSWWVGVDCEPEKVDDYQIFSVNSRKALKNNIRSIRAVLSLRCPSIGTVDCAFIETSTKNSFLAVNKGQLPSQGVLVNMSAPVACVAAHTIALGLNLTFSPTQQPVAQFISVNFCRNASASTHPTLLLVSASELLPPLFPVTIDTFERFAASRFRMEFVRDYAEPLCSTAMYSSCPFGRQNRNKVAIFRAMLHLLNHTVPLVAGVLDAEPFPLHGEDLCRRVHNFGLNLRFLGWLLPWMTNPEAIRGVVTEIAARAYKYVGDDEEGETKWSSLARIAVNRFFPYHLHMPLPTFHRLSFAFLQRLHSRYGVDIDTLEQVSDANPIDGVDLNIQLDGSIPHTPHYGDGFDYDTSLGPEAVDDEKFRERIVELCQFRHRIRPLPGGWSWMTREHIIEAPSRVALKYFNHLQDSALWRSDALGVTSARLCPLLAALAMASSALFPFEKGLCTDQSASLYIGHAYSVMTHEELRNIFPEMPQLAQSHVMDFRAELIAQSALHAIANDDYSRAMTACDEAFQLVSDERYKLGLLGILEKIASSSPKKASRNQNSMQLLADVIEQELMIVQQLFPATHEERQRVENASRNISEVRSKTKQRMQRSVSFIGQGVSIEVIGRLRDSINGYEANPLFCPPMCARMSTSVTGVESVKVDAMTIVSHFLGGETVTEHAFQKHKAQNPAMAFLHELDKKKCLVFIAQCSKTTVLGEIGHFIVSAKPLTPHGSRCEIVPIYIDASAHGPLDESFFSRALSPLSETQIESLMKNPRLLLLLDGVGMGPLGLEPVLPSAAIFSFAGKMILTVKKSICLRYSNAERFHMLFPEQHRDRFSSSTVEIFEMQEFTPEQVEAVVSHHCLHTKQLGKRKKYLHALRRSIPRAVQLISDPFLLVKFLQVIDEVLAVDTPSGWVRVVDVFDAIVYRWLQEPLSNEENCDGSSPMEVLRESLHVALQMMSSGTYTLELCGKTCCCPPWLVRTEDKVSFVHPVFRSYFLSVKLLLEMLDPDETGSTFSLAAAQKMFSDLVSTQKEAARRRSLTGVRSVMLRGFSLRGSQAMLLKAAGRLRRKHLNGGEWLVNNSIAASTDLYLLDMLSDRVLTIVRFQDTLWSYLQTRYCDMPLLMSNAATILVRAGCSFSGRNLRNVILSQADLNGIVCSAADVRDTVCRYARAHDANLDFAELRGSDWKSIDLGAKLQMMQSKHSSFLCMCFSPKGPDVLATGDERGAVSFWDCETATSTNSVAHGCSVGTVRFDFEGTRLLSTSLASDGLIKVWNCSDLKDVFQVAVLKGHNGHVCGADFLCHHIIVSASADCSIQLWSVASLTDICSLNDVHSAVVASPRIVPGSPRRRRLDPILLPACRHDKHPVHCISSYMTVTVHKTAITALAACRATGVVASLDRSGSINVVDAASGDIVCRFTAFDGTRGVSSICMSPDGEKLAIPQKRGLALHNTKTGAVVRLLSFPFGTDISSAVAFSPDGALIAAAQDSKVVVWDVASGHQILCRNAHKSRISAVLFNPIGSSVFTCSWDCSLHMWPIAVESQGRIAPAIREYKFLCIGNRGRHVVTVASDGTTDAWDAVTGTHLGACADQYSLDPTVAAADNESDFCAVGGTLGKIFVLSISRQYRPRLLEFHSKPVSSLCFVPSSISFNKNSTDDEGNYKVPHKIIVSTSIDRAFCVWDAISGTSVYREMRDLPLCALTLGQNCCFLVNGFLSTKQLMIQPLTFMSYTNAQTYPVSMMLGRKLTSFDKPEEPAARYTLRWLTVLMCALKRQGIVPGDVVKHILPFTRKSVFPVFKQSVGPLKTLVKEGQVHVTTAANDTLVAVALDRYIHVWDMVRRVQLRGGEVHSLPITSLHGVADSDCVLLASSSLDGTAIVSNFATGERVVCIRPALSHPLHCIRFVNSKAAITCGADRILRRWNLKGVSCSVGSLNPFASMTWRDLKKWLHNIGLSDLEAPLQGLTALGVMDLPSFDLEVKCQGASSTSIERLKNELDDVRKQSYKSATLTALDDATISVETFSGYSPEKVIEWCDGHGMRLAGLLISMAKMSGLQLLHMAMEQLMQIGSLNYDNLVGELHEEMAFVRSKMAGAFGEKTVDDVAAWAKPKHLHLQLTLLLLQYNGTQLLDHTNFTYRTMTICPDCKRIIADASTMCPIRLSDHSHVPVVYDQETSDNVGKLTARLKESHEAVCVQLHQALMQLPDAFFEHGLHWTEHSREEGSVTAVSFHVPEIASPQNLIINNASLSIFSTTKVPGMMVVASAASEDLLRSMASLKWQVSRHLATGGELSMPTPWRKCMQRDQIVYSCGAFEQTTHPSMPRAATLGQSGSCLVMTLQKAEPPKFIENAKAPKKSHFFEKIEENEYVANVCDQLTELVRQKERYITFLIVNSESSQSGDTIRYAQRPKLKVNYYYSDRLCNCKSGTTKQPSIMCDRFCNVESTCVGHSCSFTTPQCRKAAFLVWQSTPTIGGSFRRISEERILNLSQVNAAYIAEWKRNQAQVGLPRTFSSLGASLASVLSDEFVASPP